MKHLLFALAILATAVPAVANEVSSDSPAPAMSKAEKKLVPVVEDYVRNNRGWMDGIYDVEFSGHDGELLVFTVFLHADDAHHLVTANGGQSFQVLVDPATKKVTGERFF